MQTPTATHIRDATFDDILGQEGTKRQLKSAWLTGRHIIIVGPPGIGKTTLARNLARLLPEAIVNDCEYNCNPADPLCPSCRTAAQVQGAGSTKVGSTKVGSTKAGSTKAGSTTADSTPAGSSTASSTPNVSSAKIPTTRIPTKKITGLSRFVRIQGSPDLMVEDLLGDIDPVKALQFGPVSLQAFTPGKIFRANGGLLFFDEVNRCPEKLQNSLLQVLEEGKATLGSYTVDLPADFMFIGTMNPEDSSTERLSDVFLDRFDVIEMGYPETLAIENTIILSKGKKLDVAFPPELLSHAIMFVRLLRESKDLEKKPSVRASLGLYERAQANAILSKRKTVTQEDIDEAVTSVISHRIQLKPSVRYLQTPEQFVQNQYKAFAAEEADRQDRGGDL